ncbi:NAD(P)H-dependent flavin oxidoreductase [Fodinicola acaciae]|uniref:NAD(P)H-dependent flavin oxidoreductase n=1 Tax=Fodinicola acaciae TaxID=2681555 RepID=UPI0013D34FF7|nr:nitronate monooxygenase [Fodinicola acaciae]
MISTELTRRLGLRLPIIGAPMGGASWGELTKAVGAAGGLGMIGVSNRSDADFVRREAAVAAEVPFGIGVQLWSLDRQPGVFEAVLESGATLVSVSFGDPGPYVRPLHEAGMLVATQVNTVAEARHAVDAGVDVVVAQGGDAGGHSGATIGTLPLLQSVLAAVGDAAPVVAAGGIGSGRGLAAVLAAGAQAAWIGTRLLGATESAGTAGARKRVLEAEESDTVLTRVFDIGAGIAWPERYPGRALRNDFSDRWHGNEPDLAADPAAGEALKDATRAGDYSQAVVYAGPASAFVRAEEPVADILHRLVAEAEDCLRAASRLTR